MAYHPRRFTVPYKTTTSQGAGNPDPCKNIAPIRADRGMLSNQPRGNAARCRRLAVDVGTSAFAMPLFAYGRDSEMSTFEAPADSYVPTRRLQG
jgi:hypothetical protein